MKGEEIKIKICEKYWLNSDAFCYWITEEYIVEKGKGAGNIAEKRCSGYVGSFQQAIDSFIERKIKGAEISDLTALVKAVDNLKTEVKSWRVDLERK